jgi:hypothetical protein
MTQVTTAGFKFFPQLNAVRGATMMSDRSPITRNCALRHFPTDTLQGKVVQALSMTNLLPAKEVLESFEFFQRVRKDVRARHMVDYCCGHGFVGLLFALFERRVDTVTLVDRRPVDTFEPLIECVAGVGSWIRDKVRVVTTDLSKASAVIPSGATLVSSHACGVLTDACIDTAIAHGVSVAVMPCCYPRRNCPAPPTLTQNLGLGVAFDVDRTYRMTRADFHVRWTAIPKEITPMNRVLIGRAPTAR